MGFLDSIKRGLCLIKLDGNAAVEIATDTSSTIYGWIFIVIASLVGAFSSSFKYPPFAISNFIIQAIEFIIGSLLFLLITHGIAKKFGGQSSLVEYFRAESHVSLLNWLTIIISIPIPFIGNEVFGMPIITLLIELWSFVITGYVIMSVHKISTRRASFVLGLALISLIVIYVIVGLVYAFLLGFFAVDLTTYLPPK